MHHRRGKGLFVRFSLQIWLCWMLQGGCSSQGGRRRPCLGTFPRMTQPCELLLWSLPVHVCLRCVVYQQDIVADTTTGLHCHSRVGTALYLPYITEYYDLCKNEMWADAVTMICPWVYFKTEVCPKFQHFHSQDWTALRMKCSLTSLLGSRH